MLSNGLGVKARREHSARIAAAMLAKLLTGEIRRYAEQRPVTCLRRLPERIIAVAHPLELAAFDHGGRGSTIQLRSGFCVRRRLSSKLETSQCPRYLNGE